MSRTNDERLLFIGVSFLTLFGLLILHSSSIVVAAERQGDPSYYFLRQVLFAGAGYFAMIALMFIDYHVWLRPKVIFALAAASAASLLLVFAQAPVKGAHRQVRFGTLLSFQPSEFAKLVILCYVAYFLHKHWAAIRHPGSRIISCALFVGLFAVLIGREPDFGQVLCILFIVTLLLFIAGLDWRYVAAAVLASVPVLYVTVWMVPYRRARILAWLAALLDPLSADHHTRQMAVAFGRGGFLGVGLGKSRQKFLFLPEVIGDSIYALIGEELGFVGAVVVLGVYIGYLILGARISMKAADRGGFYLGLGITLMLVLQAFVNMSSALAIAPNKGITLPFISQGGSSLIVSLMGTGVLLNIASQRGIEASSSPAP